MYFVALINSFIQLQNSAFRKILQVTTFMDHKFSHFRCCRTWFLFTKNTKQHTTYCTSLLCSLDLSGRVGTCKLLIIEAYCSTLCE